MKRDELNKPKPYVKAPKPDPKVWKNENASTHDLEAIAAEVIRANEARVQGFKDNTWDARKEQDYVSLCVRYCFLLAWGVTNLKRKLRAL